MYESVISSVAVDNLKNDKKTAVKAVLEFKRYPRVYVEFAAKADKLIKAINEAPDIAAVNRIMTNAHSHDDWSNA